MKFPTITIPDPAAVGKWLDDELGVVSLPHSPCYYASGWGCNHWHLPCDYVSGNGATPEELLSDLRAKLAENDPLAKLRKEAEKAGFTLTPLPA
jgi:hypothetical protein